MSGRLTRLAAPTLAAGILAVLACNASTSTGGAAGATSAQQVGGQQLGDLAAAVQAPAPSGQGRLVAYLTDKPAPNVDELWVRITSVTAHSTTSGWVTLYTHDPKDPPFDVDLLSLQSTSIPLGFANLPAGTITQIRLVVDTDGNRVVVGGQDIPLKVPSGYQSGIKIHGPWQVGACKVTAVTLDFDGKQSIWYHPTGQEEEWILRPVIRVKSTDEGVVSCADDGETVGVTPPAATGPVSCDPAQPSCPGGDVCVAGSCLAPAGAPCTGASECASGTCDATGHCGAGGVGTVCFTPTECLSGSCSADSACSPGGPGAACVAGGDCVSGTCTDGACAAGSAKSAGQPCTVNAECLSSVCTAGACDKGVPGAACVAPTDCWSNSCSAAGYCVALQAM